MKSRNYLSALAVLLLSTQSATAGNFDFSGNLSQDDSVQFFSFTLTSPSMVEIDTTSYALGGFTPLLTLWNSAGTNFGATPIISSGDAIWSVNLNYSTPDPTGVYYLALSENPNFYASGQDLTFLTGGIPDTSYFQYDTQGNFTRFAANSICNSDQSGGFYQVDPNSASITGCLQRTNAWSLTISGAGVSNADLYPATPSTAPEPAALMLTLVGLAGMAGFTRRRSA